MDNPCRKQELYKWSMCRPCPAGPPSTWKHCGRIESKCAKARQELRNCLDKNNLKFD